jgi:acyl-CoA reductase-like NAD-dependent aldehyde dehydrogenase
MAGLTGQSLRVPKTIKLFIGGEFPRTESGRSFDVFSKKGKKLYAHLCLASRKDLRNAVTAAQSALTGWQKKDCLQSQPDFVPHG